MNANEISNADLDAILSGNVPTVGEVIALARAELDRRKTGEQKGELPLAHARYWQLQAYDDCVCREEVGIIIECHKFPDWEGSPLVYSSWSRITAAEYEAAKAKPEPVASFCHDCGTVHEGGCVNTSEAKDPAHQPDCAISLMPPPPEEGYRYDLQALHDKINEIIAAVNRLAKEGK